MQTCYTFLSNAWNKIHFRKKDFLNITCTLLSLEIRNCIRRVPRTNSINIHFCYKNCLSVIAGRDEISKYVKKLQKGVAKLFDKRFSIDVSDGGEKWKPNVTRKNIKYQHSTGFYIFRSDQKTFKSRIFFRAGVCQV